MMASLDAFWEFIKQQPESFSVAGAILLGLIGYIAKYVSELRAKSYEARLGFVTAQLKDLYGPLYLLSGSNDKTWVEFRQRFRPNRPMFDDGNPLTPEEKHEYVRWLEVSFVPCNSKMRRVIEANAHLFIGGKVPDAVLQLLAHFDELNVVLSKLKDGTDDNVFPNLMYPKGFGDSIRNDYQTVVKNHSRMTRNRR